VKREEMNPKVADELKCIPRIKGDLEQNLFRSFYNMIRRHDLATNPAMPARESFKKALEHARKTSPNFSPIYNSELLRM